MEQKRTGAFLQRRRKEASLSQAELAAGVGVKRETVSDWERGGFKHPIPPNLANAIARRLGNISVLELVRAMGYEADCGGLSDEELRLVEAYRRLPAPERAAVLRGAGAELGTRRR